MGTGVGVNCDGCDNQLTYDRDCEEIFKHIQFGENQEIIIIKSPVLCHECTLVVNRLKL